MNKQELLATDFLEKVREILPNAEIAEDIDDQVIIYTGLMMTDDDTLVKYVPREELE